MPSTKTAESVLEGYKNRLSSTKTGPVVLGSLFSGQNGYNLSISAQPNLAGYSQARSVCSMTP
jgi:hypothetical protein